MTMWAVQVRGEHDGDVSGRWVTLGFYPRNDPAPFKGCWEAEGDNAAYAAAKAREYYDRPVRVLGNRRQVRRSTDPAWVIARNRAERMPCNCECTWCAELLELTEDRGRVTERLLCASGRTFRRVWIEG